MDFMVLSSPATKVQLMTETSRVITGVTESGEMQPEAIGDPEIGKKRIGSYATILLMKTKRFWIEIALAIYVLLSF